MTYRLRTLGGLALESDAGSKGGATRGAASQRRTLALLALIAAAGERGIARDKLLAYLWPESEPEKARHTLTQSLYALRRDLKADDLFEGTTELKLNRQLVSVDVLDLEAALDRGELDRAVALYAGPFLDGFFLGSAPEFERWVDAERRRIGDRVSQAIETLARQAAARGDHRAAVEQWRRLAALDPYSGRIALGLMRALVAAGDRAGALQHARVHETLLKGELELAPDPEVTRLADELREFSTATTLPPTSRAAVGSPAMAPAAISAAPQTVASPPAATGGLLRRSSAAALSALRRTAPLRLLTSTTLRASEVAEAERAAARRARRRQITWAAVGGGTALLLVAAIVGMARCS